MSRGFADHFSAGAAQYGEFRPHYPDCLFDLLAARSPARGCAWDCATGSGQALDGLVRRYACVVASDASLAQLREAPRDARVLLVAARAERVPLPAASVDLVSVAQALHWFDLPAFFAEAARVLKPGGLLAVWTYNRCQVEPAVDRVIEHFYRDEIGAFWPPDRRLVEEAYASIELPWAGETVLLEMQQRWTLERLVAYLGTWSAVTRYRRERGEDPLPALHARLRAAWPDAGPRVVRWPLTVKLAYRPR